MSRVAGFGFRKGATTESLLAVLRLVEAEGGPATAVATVQAKAAAPALLRLAAARGLPVQGVVVADVATPTRSARVAALHGTGSVAEAAALTGAGPGATLIVGRVTAPDGMATCAMAAGKEQHE